MAVVNIRRTGKERDKAPWSVHLCCASAGRDVPTAEAEAGGHSQHVAGATAAACGKGVLGWYGCTPSTAGVTKTSNSRGR